MKREIITTTDGSKTIQLTHWNEQYHSIHGALQEARYVFVKQGLHYVREYLQLKHLSSINILEIGFGTGLNAYLTLLEAETLLCNINYVGIEAYPVTLDEVGLLDYPKTILGKPSDSRFFSLHTEAWENELAISPHFNFTKKQQFFKDISEERCYHLIYFDAFGARVQPELWEAPIFKIMYNALKENGVLVTYAAKGSVRRAMQNVGFVVERLPGPPGKREMLRAFKRVDYV